MRCPFVGDTLLSESGMRNHPLTPMTDSNLVRVLGRQTTRRVGLVDRSIMDGGVGQAQATFAALRSQAVGIAVVDALDDAHLVTLGKSCAGMTLITGGSGLAIGSPENFRERGLLPASTAQPMLHAGNGGRAVIAGSCSSATQQQVATMAAQQPSWRIDPLALASDQPVVSRAIEWAKSRLQEGPVLIYASADAAEVEAVQKALGAGRAGVLVERALSEIAVRLVEIGVSQMIVAGGETSGAVVKALGVKAMQIGPEIDPGVSWTAALGTARPLMLALQSGNFGTPDFFMKAWSKLSPSTDAE